jgi:hypothetical protein
MPKRESFLPSADPATVAFLKGGKAETQKDASTETKRLTIDLPADLHRRFKIRAATDGTSMVDLVRDWIEGYVR